MGFGFQDEGLFGDRRGRELESTGNLLIFAPTSWGKFRHKHWKTDLFCEPSLIDLGY